MSAPIKEGLHSEASRLHQLDMGIFSSPAMKEIANSEVPESDLDELSLSLDLRRKLTRKGQITLPQIITIAYEEVHVSGITQDDIYDLYDALTELGQREEGDLENESIMRKNIILPRRIEVVLEEAFGKPSDDKEEIMTWVKKCLKHIEFYKVDALVVLIAAFGLKVNSSKETLKKLFETRLNALVRPEQRMRIIQLLSFYNYPQYAKKEDERILIEGVTLGMIATRKSEYRDEIQRNRSHFAFHSFAHTSAEEMIEDQIG